MTTTTVQTFTAHIYVGLQVHYTGGLIDLNIPIETIRQYANTVGLCVSVTRTRFVYTNGGEPGFIVGLINYPRFPSSPEIIKAHALALAEALLKCCQQMKVTVVLPNETIMLIDEELQGLAKS